MNRTSPYPLRGSPAMLADVVMMRELPSEASGAGDTFTVNGDDPEARPIGYACGLQAPTAVKQVSYK